MKIIKRIVPATLSCVMLITAVTPTFAGETSSQKEEVIYINLQGGGEVKDLYAVNIFDKGEVTDYGDYSSVEMLNTTDKITQNGDKISFTASEDRVYYKGKIDEKEIPWNISIEYLLDGKEYSPSEIAGKSGKLEIRFKVTENKNCKGDFFENYALQASFSLDTEKCKNIEAPDATMANVGSAKQISYTMLPGEGIDAKITADVKNFEMDSASINGVPLSMNIEVDDEELLDEVNQLVQAVEELDNGTGDLKNGVSELKTSTQNDLQSGVTSLANGALQLYEGAGNLKDGGDALENGTKDLKDGASSLNKGVGSLKDGVGQIEEGLKKLNGNSKNINSGSTKVNEALLSIQKELANVSSSTEEIDTLVSGSSQIKEGINSLAQGITDLQNNVSFAMYKNAMKQNGLDIDELQTANIQTVASLQQQIATLNEQIAYLEQVGGDQTQIAQLKASVKQLEDIATLLQGNIGAIQGMDGYLTQINTGIGELASGVGTLKENYSTFDKGINDLATQLKGLMTKMSTLKTGIDTLVTEYGKL
ncbi:MAG: hypothetical protein ACI4RL_03490, partial [Ruminococcus sp.]